MENQELMNKVAENQKFWQDVGKLWQAYIKPARKEVGLFYKKPIHYYIQKYRYTDFI